MPKSSVEMFVQMERVVGASRNLHEIKRMKLARLATGVVPTTEPSMIKLDDDWVYWAKTNACLWLSKCKYFFVYLSQEFGIVYMYNTPAKARESVDVARSGLYTWSGCEQRRGNIGYKISSLARAKGVTALRRK